MLFLESNGGNMKIKNFIDNVYYQIDNCSQRIAVVGWSINEQFRNDFEVSCKINGRDVDFTVEKMDRNDVAEKYSRFVKNPECGFLLKTKIDIDEKIDLFEVFIKYDEKSRRVVKCNSGYLKRRKACIEKVNEMFYEIDNEAANDNLLMVYGWAVMRESNDKINYKVVNSKNEPVDFQLKEINRIDVLKVLEAKHDNIMCGFNIRFMYDIEETYYLVISCLENEKRIKISPKQIKKQTEKGAKSNSNVGRFVSMLKLKKIVKGIVFAKNNGFKETIKKVKKSINANNEADYEKWFKANKATKEQLELQRKKKFQYEPKISIIVPTYKTPKKFLKEMIDSVVEQTYTNWELCIGDGSADDISVKEVLEQYAKKDSRIKYDVLKENLGISGNTNAALALATGDFIALLDHDDLLAPNALYEVVRRINKYEDVDVVYTDEDKISMDLKSHFQPHFKPDFNIDLLRSNNYICHFFVARKTVVDKVGGFRSEYDGSQDYDFIFRCTQEARRIEHIAKILYYWRMHKNSVAENPESKMYAFEAGKKAIEDNLRVNGLKATVSHTKYLGFYRVKYDVKDSPLVSIIIPNKDEKSSLKQCIDSILEKTTYSNYEIIVVENNSTCKEIFEYYNEIEKNEKIKVVMWKDEFNYSAINNYGVNNSNGEFIILLNNDTQIITPDWIEVMLGECQREDVGIVGAKLLYPDNTVQHAGVIIGLGGIAGHAMVDIEKDEPGYFAKALIQQDLSAVTAACLMVKRKVFDEVGGLEEKLKVAFNDVDFCLKVREKGYLIIFEPNVLLYHYESKSRGAENTLEKISRFEGEIAYMEKEWKKILKNGDPYYNPNLSLEPHGYKLKKID